jgi:outer membrane protein assembly factor BamB
MKHKIFKLFFISSTLFLISCEGDKKPLEGKREDFISSLKPIHLARSKVKDIKLPKPIKNNVWEQSGYNESHVTNALSLNKSLSKKWEKSINHGISSGQKMMPNMVANKDRIFSMNTQGEIFSFSKDGILLWQKETSPKDEKSKTLGGGLSCDKNTLIVTTSFGNVLAFKADTGELLWDTALISPIRGAATLSQGKVFVISISNEISVLDIKTGIVLWQQQGITEFSTLLGSASPCVIGDIVIVPYSSGEYCAYDIENGSTLWTDTLTSSLKSDTYSSISHIRSNPIGETDKVFVISHGGKMVANDIKQGSRIWQKEVGGYLDAALAGDFLFMITHEQNLIAIEKTTGATKWQTSLPSLIKDAKNQKKVRFTAPLIANNQIIVTTNIGELLFINAENGTLKTTLKIDEKINTTPMIIDNKLIMLSDDAKISCFG